MKWYAISLRRFGEGEGGAAAAPSGGAPGSSQTGAAGTRPAAAGEHPAAADAGEPSARQSFDELIRGEYKKDFDDRVRTILDRRLKGSKAEIAAMRPVMALLQQRYGIADGRGAAEAVRRALENDKGYWDAGARQNGMDAESYRRVVRAEAQSSALKKLVGDQLTRENENAERRRLAAEVEAVKRQYPEFDVQAELNGNPQFEKLLRSRVDMLTAYQVCHQQELVEQARRQGAQEQLERARENRLRPAENGAGGSRPVRLSSDPSKWTREQLRDVERRVQRGEKIVL